MMTANSSSNSSRKRTKIAETSELTGFFVRFCVGLAAGRFDKKKEGSGWAVYRVRVVRGRRRRDRRRRIYRRQTNGITETVHAVRSSISSSSFSF